MEEHSVACILSTNPTAHYVEQILNRTSPNVMSFLSMSNIVKIGPGSNLLIDK